MGSVPEVLERAREEELINTAPLVSVIIPTFNRGKVLLRSISSVLEQSYKNLEAIVVDDASEDETTRLLEELSDPRVRCLRVPERRGSAVARNMGIGIAKGEYIAFQDSDDEWHPMKLKRQMDAFALCPHETGVVYCGFKRPGRRREHFFPARPGPKDGDIYRILLRGNLVSTQTAVVRRTCFETCGYFDEALCSCEDWDLFLRISEQWSFRFLSEALVRVHTTSSSLMTNREIYIRGFHMFLKKHLARYEEAPGALWRHYYDIGTRLLGQGKLKQAAGYFWSIVRIWDQVYL